MTGPDLSRIRARLAPRLSRAYWNLRLLGLPNVVRDLWMVAVTVLVVVSLAQGGEIVARLDRLVRDQQAQVAKNTKTAAATEEALASTNRALCIFRHDLEQRAATGRKFLKDHPHGFAGISASSIRVSLAGQERTIAALSGLNCPH